MIVALAGPALGDPLGADELAVVDDEEELAEVDDVELADELDDEFVGDLLFEQPTTLASMIGAAAMPSAVAAANFFFIFGSFIRRNDDRANDVNDHAKGGDLRALRQKSGAHLAGGFVFGSGVSTPVPS